MNLTEQIWSLIHYQQHECYVLWLVFITCHSKLVHGFIMLMGIYKWDVMWNLLQAAHIYNLQNVVLYCICKCTVLQLLAVPTNVSFLLACSLYTRSTTRVLRVYESWEREGCPCYIFNVLVDLLYDYLVPRYVPGTVRLLTMTTQTTSVCMIQ